MTLQPVLAFVRTLMQNAIHNGDIAIDATVGNGHDTVFLAKLVGEAGKVYGFDIQAEAIEVTKKRLIEEDLAERVALFQLGHENAETVIPLEDHGNVATAIFNLGYLPKGDKTIITKPKTTISAVEQMLKMLKVGGIVVLVVYHGHDGGAEERDTLLQYVTTLNQGKFHVLQYSFINQRNHPPFVLAIEKR